jgi:putative pyruvate formate lyase activating enzyme
MLGLQRQGCHNLNLVTPSHVVPQILEALAEAVDMGMDLPVVYNTSGFDSPAALALMEGVVDIYMPDFKLWSERQSRDLLTASGYPAAARAAIGEMHRQVGDLQVDAASGLARRGVLLRHLVMPGLVDETAGVLTWVAGALGTDTYVNLMDQYRPAGAVGGGRHVEIDRTVAREEYREALAIAAAVGLHSLDGYRRA